MKKYLNSNLFYQGDANIFLPLCIVYIVNFILMLTIANNYFRWEITEYLYNNLEVRYIFTFDGVLLLTSYIFIIYVITVGMFKRKKWSTFLAGPVSRLDIRARELIIIIISAIIYILIFLSVILKNYIQYYDILVYITDFNKILIIDILRIISIATLIIGILSIMDTIFSNIYYLVGYGICFFIYIISLLSNFNPILTYYKDNIAYGAGYFYNLLRNYLGLRGISDSQIIEVSSVFLITGIILIYISKILTNKMLVENMNEGIIFNLPKKFAKFIMVTFVGVVFAPYISSIIYEVYFEYSLSDYQLVAINTIVILLLSIITYFLVRNFKKVKKDVYY